MARGEDISTDSSEMAVVLDVCESSINEAVPIDPPETSYLTAMPDVRQPLTELPRAENFSESKWKPLIGTPSKSPIPDNIFVPDPSPARTISDSASTIMPALSTPDSFVHQRRQGEYVPRPAIWTVYNMDGTISTSVNPPDLMTLANDDSEEALPLKLTHAPMLKHENRRLSNYNLSFSDIKLQGVGFDKTVMKMGEVFMDRPLMVNMMRLTGPQTLPQPNSHRVPSGVEGGSRIVPYVKSSDHMPPASVTRDSEVREDCSSVPSAEPPGQGCTRENNTDYGHTELFAAATTDYTPSYSPEDPDLILNQPRHLAQCDENQPTDDLITDSIASDVPQEPEYAIIEGPGRSIERLPRYVDLRVRLTQDQPNPLMNYMTVGSFITYVGLTRFPDSITGIASEFELPLNSRYLVADIYGDYWGLLIRLERGLELGEIQPSYFLGRKSKPRAPERMRYPERTRLIGVRNDPKYIVYAPLCAFTLTANEGTVQSQTEPESSHGSVSTASHGRLAQAAIRSYSNDAEAEAVMDRFTFIPKTVYRQYVAYFARSRARHDAVTDRPQRPSPAENRKPSVRSRAVALKSSTGTSKAVKNIPTQNIKDLFMRKKDTNVVSVSSTAKFDDIAAPGRARHGICGDGSCSPRFVAARAPQIPSLPSSFQSLSLGPPDEPFDAPPTYFDSNRRRSSSLRVGDTNLRSIPSPPNDSVAISRQDERQSPAEISVPMTNPQSQNTDQKMAKERGSSQYKSLPHHCMVF